MISMKLITNELIPVYETDLGNKVVDGRELHEFLEVGDKFSQWIERRIEKYGFVNGEDFFTISGKSTGGRPTTEYIIKLDVAKEFCMVENNEQGRKARKYFIKVEKDYKAQMIDVSRLSPQMQMFHYIGQAVANLEIEAAKTKEELAEVKTTVETIQETFLQRDDDWRKSINSLLNGAAFRLGGNYQDLRNESYRLLEERGRCDLNTRLRNLKVRLEESGATKTKIDNTTRMDVIESDPRLKEIYTTIVKELSIGSLKVKSS
ncbi:antA/AntB antirepressor family protein [Effusibacillus consociatus]|uniref:AntA/AntB antirepressor family protein n=1 Tax=Effusibacillus consociatus TaxID=1117041 RepID=A0ABV9Q4I1_9BACL